MTDEEAREQFERQLQERVETLRKAFAPLTQRLLPADEPATLFQPPHES